MQKQHDAASEEARSPMLSPLRLGTVSLLCFGIFVVCFLCKDYIHPRAVHVDLHIEKVEYKQILVEYKKIPVAPKQKIKFLVTVRAINRSGHKAWYKGSHQSPERVVSLLVDGKWKFASMSTTSLGRKVEFDSSETFTCDILTDTKLSEIDAIKVSVQFGSSYWFGYKDKTILVEAVAAQRLWQQENETN